ncbi:Ku protein [Streptomyces sp. NPDC091292]|uniref:non-homologous end joining protein Ku n=1 Tax=Streptomyces sp. NPDC091292 TaxID=3365991 RepID=UPI00381D87F8
MPTVWSGAISFGLVTIPIRVEAATLNRNITFHQYHLTDMARVRVKKVCELDGKALDAEDIGRGYETSDGGTIEITDDELDAMPLPTAKAIEIEAFVPADSIDPIRIGQGYYLEPDGQVAAKPYVLLRKALERNAKVAVAKFSWHDRERLGLLRVKDGVIALHAMKWPDEIRSPQELAPPQTAVPDAEVDEAVQLLEAMEVPDLTGYRDEYRAALEKVIEAKLEGAPLPAAPEEAPAPASGGVVDLMAALEQSVARARESRGEATVHDMPKKRAAQKAAKKAAGRKPRSA